MSFRLVSVSIIVLGLALAAAEARRGFSSGGSGSGSYDGSVSTSSWDLSATPDADCIAVYGQACSELTTAQKEEVAAKTASAQAANYTNHSDYETASAKGYALTAADGTQWTNAKSPGSRGSDTTTNAQWDTDCDNSFSSTGGCDGLTKTQFATIDNGSTGRAPALTAGYSGYNDWQSASALNYTMSADDATLWGEANDGSVSSAACDAEFAGKACNELTKASFENAKASNALMTAKIAKVTAGTLNNQDLTDLSISFASSSLSSPLLAWQLDYLETVLGTTSSTTKANWQTTIDNYSATAASKWYVYKIATSSDTSGTYATSNATQALLDACGLTVSGANSELGPATDAQISAHIRHADSDLTSLSGAPTDTQLNDFLTEAVGYADGTTYADFNTATTSNGWTAANYKEATNTSGWSNSSAEATAFGNCRSSTTSSTGGANTCSVSYTGWTAIAAAIAAAADTSTDVTAANVTAILTATGTTANSYLDTSNSVHMDYINQCIAGDSNPADTLSSCVSTSDLKKNVKAFQVGKIAALNSGSYTKTSITSTLLKQIGVPTNSANVIDSNNCGTGGDSSCLTALRDAIVASDLDETATPTTVTNKINELMRAQMLIVANNTSIPSYSSTMKAGCSTSYNLPLPDPCGHSQWSCSKVQGPSNWSISGTNLVVPSNSSATGNQNVKIRMSLNIYTPAYTKDVTRTYSVSQAVAASANGYKKFSTSGNNPWGPWNDCIAKGGDLATYANVNGTYTLDSHMWFAPSTEVSPSNLCCSSKNYKAWVSESEITCRKSGTNGQSKRGGYGNQWWHCNPSQSSYVKTYWCKNLPSC